MNKIEEALNGLLKKYDVQPDKALNLLPGWEFIGKKIQNGDVPLLTWRSNRKFTELKKIVSARVIENVCMLRFSCFGSSDTWSFEALLYREFDLCEFLSGGRIMSLHATITAGQAGNVIVRLDNGIIGSVEVGTQLPSGHKMVDRHEIIARRGVASDIVVDTQVPQSSIYSYTDQGLETYKDVDNELFGFDELEVEHIRSAFEVMKNPEITQELIRQHNHLTNLVKTALESDSQNRKVEIKAVEHY
jgi:hypothetical protein